MGMLDDLREIALAIKDETAVGGNTADRVGGLFDSLLQKLQHELYPDAILVDMDGSDINLTEGHRLLVVVSSSGGQLKLASSDTCIGRKHTIINLAAGEVDVVPSNVADAINMDEDMLAIGQGDCISLYATAGNHWFVIGK